MGQQRLGPAFLDGFAGYLLSRRARIAHGPGLGFSCNLTSDGGFTEPVAAGEQWTVTPSYLVFWSPLVDLPLVAHLGPVFQLSGHHKSQGAEVAFGAGYRVLAGAGFYAEAGASVFGGAYSVLHPLLGLEIGIFLDHEVLP